MIYFAILLIPAVIITLIAKFYYHKDICGKESLISLSINITTSLLFCGLIYLYIQGQLSDNYVVNGAVLSKQQVRTSCEHSYECNCYTSCSGSGQNQTCTRICQTCYEHSHDYDWRVNTNVGSLNISRVDRQGKNTPPRFNQVVVGEPVAMIRNFNNYLLADKNSLFNHYADKHFQVPSYPLPYDYYRINRVFGYKDNSLNNLLSEFLINKRYNIVVIFTDKDVSYKDSLMSQWKGGKRNDIIMVYGMSGDKINWFFSDSYGKGIDNRLLHDKLTFSAVGAEFNDNLFVSHLNMIDKEFKQVDTEQFEHLRNNINIPFWFLFIIFGLNVATSIGVSYYMKENRL